MILSFGAVLIFVLPFIGMLCLGGFISDTILSTPKVSAFLRDVIGTDDNYGEGEK